MCLAALQSISVMEFRRAKAGVRGPFLVVAPLTTLGHWAREIETWTPMNCVTFSGCKEDRAVRRCSPSTHDGVAAWPGTAYTCIIRCDVTWSLVRVLPRIISGLRITPLPLACTCVPTRCLLLVPAEWCGHSDYQPFNFI